MLHYLRKILPVFLLLSLCSVPAAMAEDNAPVNVRAIGGSVMGGTWNVAFTGLGKLLKDNYPGSNVNVLLGASVSNPLKIENNGGDISATQSYNITAGLKGRPPFKKPLQEVASIANVNDTTVIHLIVAKDVPADSLEEIVEKKIPLRLDPGAKGTLSNILGELLLKEMGASYADIIKWGGRVTPVSGADRTGMMQDGTINASFIVGSIEQSQLQEMVINSGIKWLTVNMETLQKVAGDTGINITNIPADLYNGAVGRDVPALSDTVHIIVRKDLPEDVVYKITKTLAEGHEYLGEVQPMWKTLKPETMPQGLVAPLHPGAEKYYREAGLLK